MNVVTSDGKMVYVHENKLYELKTLTGMNNCVLLEKKCETKLAHISEKTLLAVISWNNYLSRSYFDEHVDMLLDIYFAADFLQHDNLLDTLGAYLANRIECDTSSVKKDTWFENMGHIVEAENDFILQGAKVEF